MWPEPLTADVARLTPTLVLIRARDGQGNAIAGVLAAHGPTSAVFGEMTVTDRNGGPRQRVRALALMVREALRYAAEIGIRDAYTDVDETRPALLAFARRIAGRAGERTRPRHARIGGQIYDMRSAALNASDADGKFRGDASVGL